MADDKYNEQTPLLANRRPADRSLTTTVNLLALLFCLLTVLMLACFPISLSISFQTQDANIDSTKEDCTPRISDPDESFSGQIVNMSKKLVYVQLDFDVSYNKCSNCDAFMPFHWVWASASTGRVFKYWQEDYSVWSFGILDLYTKRDVHLNVSVPEGCNLVPGTPSTMNLIAEALNNLTGTVLKSHYKNSLWCYKSKLHRKSNFFDMLERNFRHFILDVENHCCQYNPMTSSCNSHPIFLSNIWTIVPFAVSYVVLLYSPLFLVFLIHWLFTHSPIPWLSWGMKVNQDHSHHDSDYIYVGFESPVSFISMLYDVIFWVIKKLPKCLMQSYVKYGLMVLVSPIVIYIKVLIYHSNKELYELMGILVAHDIPIGFSSMTFDFKSKSSNFLTLFFGPCIFFTAYYMLGISFVFLTSVLRDTINVTVDFGQRCIPLSSLNLHLFKCVGNESLKSKTLNIIAENSIEHSLSSSFWRDVWRGYRRDSWLLFGVVKFLLSFMVHQLPFVFSSHLILRTNMHAVSEKMSHTVCRKYPKTGFCLTGCLCLVLGCCHFVLAFAVATIVFASLEYFALVTTFSFVTLVMYPADSEGYFLFGASALIYLSRCFRGIAHKYQHLLFLSVEASKKVKKQNLRHDPLDPKEYLRHVNGSYGIPRELFEEIINVYEPRRNTFIKALFKKMIVGSFLGWLLYLIVNLREGHTTIDQLVKAFTAFVIVSIPELISLLTKDTLQQTEDVIRKNHLKFTIQKYWERRTIISSMCQRSYSTP